MATKVKLIADSIITTDQLDTASLDAHFTGGTGVTYSGGTISIGQAVHSTDSPTFADLTVTGNLNITGDINSYNVTDLDVTDKTITLGAGQIESNSGGSGIIVDGSGASILWDETNTEWDFNSRINVPSAFSQYYSIRESGTQYGFIGQHKTLSGTGTDTSLTIFSETGDGINFAVNGSVTKAVVIDSEGDVGIGDATPSYKLDVNNTSSRVRFKATTGHSNLELSSIAGRDYLLQSLSTGNFVLHDEDANTNRLIIDTAGGFNPTGVLYLGSGHLTASPSDGVIAAAYADGYNNAGGDLELYGGRSTGDNSGGEIRFFTGAAGSPGTQINSHTRRMTIDANGNVGIGTDTPAKKLEIFGSGSENGILVKNDTNTNYRGYYISSVESDNTAYGKFHMDVNSGELNITSGFTDWGGFITLDTNGTQRMYINTNGEVSIGWPSGGGPGDGLLQVQGQGMFTNGGAGYVQGTILLRSSDNDQTPSYRGQGIYTWNRGSDVSWYIGTPYTNGDIFTINRKSSETSFTGASADVSDANTESFLTIANNGRVGLGLGLNNPATNLHVYGATPTSAVMAKFERTSGSSNWIQITGNTSNSFQLGSTPAGIEFYDDASSTYVAKINNSTNKHNLQKWCYALFDPHDNGSNSALEEKGATAAAVYKLYNAIINPGTYSNTGLYYVGIGRENSDVGYVEFKTEVVECRSMEVSFHVANSADGTTRYARLYYSYDGKTYTQVASTSYGAGGGTATYNLNLTSVLHSGNGDYSGSIYWRCALEDAASSHTTLIGWNHFEFKAFAESMTFDGRYQRGIYGSGTSLVNNSGASNEVNYYNNQLPYVHEFTLNSGAASAIVSSNDGYVTLDSRGYSYLNKELFNIVTGTYSGIRVLAEGTIHYNIHQDIITTGSTSYTAMNVYRVTSNGGANINVGQHLRTNTDGEWDTISGSGAFDVQPGDIIRVRHNAVGINALDAGSWSSYSFMFIPVTTSGKGRIGGNANFPWAGSQFS